jgi:hypothetical protein
VQGSVGHRGVIDGQFVVKHRHLHDPALQRANVEIEIPDLLVLKIGHVEKFLRKDFSNHHFPGASFIVETRL